MKRTQSKWELGASSQTGYVRKENEDRMSSIRILDYRLYLVVDGMGGHKAGARAAELSIQSLQDCMTNLLPAHAPEEAIAAAFTAANQIVYAQAHSEDAATMGMGATAVMLLTQGPLAYIAHVGDSRAYRFTQGKLERLTKDHSPMERMIDAGILTTAEARIHPQASMIDKALGDKPVLEAEVAKPFKLEEGDGVLLCSDGLCGYVDDGVIEAVLKRSGRAQEAADNLVQQALKTGGEDNITVQFIRLIHQGGQEKATGIGSWINNWLQLKARTGFLIALIASCALAALVKLIPLPLELPPTQQAALNAPPIQNQNRLQAQPIRREEEKPIDPVQARMDGMQKEIADLKTDLKTVVEKLTEHPSKPIKGRHHDSAKAKIFKADKNTPSLNSQKNRANPPVKSGGH